MSSCGRAGRVGAMTVPAQRTRKAGAPRASTSPKATLVRSAGADRWAWAAAPLPRGVPLRVVHVAGTGGHLRVSAVRGLPGQLVFPVATTSADSPDLAAAKRLRDADKDQGFRFRIAPGPGPDDPLAGVRQTLEFFDELYLGGFWKPDACTAIRRRRCALLVPGGLPVTARVEGDALTVLHTVVTDWECS